MGQINNVMKNQANNNIPPGTKYVRIRPPKNTRPFRGRELLYYRGVNWKVNQTATWMSAILTDEVAAYWINVRGAETTTPGRFMKIENYKDTGPA